MILVNFNRSTTSVDCLISRTTGAAVNEATQVISPAILNVSGLA
jgi:hypothetical protein